MKRTSGVLLVLVAALALAACTEPETGGLPTAGGNPTASASAGPADQERAFVTCMRQAGIADMPDPVPGDTSGRSAVRYAMDVMGKGLDRTFQDALEQCKGLLPVVPPKPQSNEDVDRVRQFAVCMRENGIPEFPDPEVSQAGSQMLFVAPNQAMGSETIPVGERVKQVNGITVVAMGDKAVNDAYQKCVSVFPSSG